VRLPWLQIDADGQTRARLLGRLLGVPEPQGIGIAMALWTWALEMSPEGDFSGTVNGDAVLLAAAVSWPTDRAAELVEQLQRVGFVATTPTLRVRGLDRYRRTWEKNRRKKSNRADSGTTVPGTGENPRGTRAEPARKTETETEKKEDVPPPDAQPPRKPSKPSAAQELFAWLNATRAAKTPLSDAPIGVVAINARFGEVLNQHGRPTIERAYLAFLEQPEPGAMDPPWPWQSFLKRLPMLAARPRLAAVPKSRTLAPGEDPYADQLA
jgi:hypothetical protein